MLKPPPVEEMNYLMTKSKKHPQTYWGLRKENANPYPVTLPSTNQRIVQQLMSYPTTLPPSPLKMLQQKNPLGIWGFVLCFSSSQLLAWHPTINTVLSFTVTHCPLNCCARASVPKFGLLTISTQNPIPEIKKKKFFKTKGGTKTFSIKEN